MNKAAVKTVVIHVQVILMERLLEVNYWILSHIPLKNFFEEVFKHLKHQVILLIKLLPLFSTY